LIRPEFKTLAPKPGRNEPLQLFTGRMAINNCNKMLNTYLKPFPALSETDNDATWITVNFWGKTAQTLSNIMGNRTKIFFDIIGELSVKNSQISNGETGLDFILNANEFWLMPKENQSQQLSNQQNQSAAQQTQSAAFSDDFSEYEEDSDVPF